MFVYAVSMHVYCMFIQELDAQAISVCYKSDISDNKRIYKYIYIYLKSVGHFMRQHTSAYVSIPMPGVDGPEAKEPLDISCVTGVLKGLCITHL